MSNKNKNRNRKHSKIDKLPKDLKEAVETMIQSDFKYQEIVDFIRDNAGIEISRTAVWRYANGLLESVKEMRLIQENFKVIIDETQKYPDMDITEAIGRMLSYKIFEAMQNMPAENWGELNVTDLIKESAKLMKVISYKKDIDIKVKNAKDIAFDSFKDEIFNLMNDENPALYKSLVTFLDEKQKDMDENVCN